MESLIDENMLKEKYPDLRYDIEKQEIQGKIKLECICMDEYINDEFEIIIQLKKNNLPKVWEVSRKIGITYPHLYENGQLCLATELEQKVYLKKQTIIDWIEEYVEKYFISYVYYRRYDIFPFGEHSHGKDGIYEFIQDYYKLKSKEESKKIYEYVCQKEYRGHLKCPCGSNKKLRDCHGELIQKILNSEEIDILKENYRSMQKCGKK